MVADNGGNLINQPLEKVANKVKKVDPQLLKIAESLETLDVY
jgi:hypothetical protein